MNMLIKLTSIQGYLSQTYVRKGKSGKRNERGSEGRKVGAEYSNRYLLSKVTPESVAHSGSQTLEANRLLRT